MCFFCEEGACGVESLGLEVFFFGMYFFAFFCVIKFEMVYC